MSEKLLSEPSTESRVRGLAMSPYHVVEILGAQEVKLESQQRDRRRERRVLITEHRRLLSNSGHRGCPAALWSFITLQQL